MLNLPSCLCDLFDWYDFEKLSLKIIGSLLMCKVKEILSYIAIKQLYKQALSGKSNWILLREFTLGETGIIPLESGKYMWILGTNASDRYRLR